ncbi:MAG: NADPH-dependent F420 reductase [Woeseiaceae bacterium]
MKKIVITFFCAVTMSFTLNGIAAEIETVAVIGTGDMGDSLGPRFAELGYRVVYGSRSPDSDKVKALVERTVGDASATTQVEAARQAGIVLTLVPWPAMATVAQNLGNLDGKIVIDVSMPFEQGDDGYPQHLLETSSAEMIQGWNPGAKVVKAFATLGSQVIDDPTVEGGLISVPIAANDRGAKEKVAGIVATLGLDPVDFGPLRMARDIEIMQMIYMIPLSQNRAQNWEFFFRRSDHYGCYLSGESTSEGLAPVYDANDLAEFPQVSGSAPVCAE